MSIPWNSSCVLFFVVLLDPIQMFTLQLLSPLKLNWLGMLLCTICVSSFSAVLAVLKRFFPWTSTRETAYLCSVVGRSYSCSALERCPLTSRISFSGTPALKCADAPVACKLWLVFLSTIPASLHIVCKYVRSFSLPTGTFLYHGESGVTTYFFGRK